MLAFMPRTRTRWFSRRPRVPAPLIPLPTITDRASVARVLAGTEWLDGESPKWVNKINVDTLAVSSARDCVCAQVFGSWLRSGYLYVSKRHDVVWLIAHGFVSGTDTTTWIALVNERRG